MRRSHALRPLSSEHHSALVLARRARVASEGASIEAARDAWAAVRAAFDAELAPHFAVEETDFLPALEAAGGVEAVQRTLSDHAALRQLVAEPAGDDPRPLLGRFASLLEAHVRFEERELFPLLEARLSLA